LMDARARMLLAGVMIATAVAITYAANWWVTGPGTRAPVNGYRYPAFAFNQEMKFTDGDNLFALASGWQEPESWGTWSRSDHAELAFRLRDGVPVTGASELLLHVHAYLAPPKVTVQHVSIWIGATKLGEAAITTEDARIAIPLTGVTLPEDPAPVVLRFDLPDQTAPPAPPGLNPLPRAIGLVSLEITH